MYKNIIYIFKLKFKTFHILLYKMDNVSNNNFFSKSLFLLTNQQGPQGIPGGNGSTGEAGPGSNASISIYKCLLRVLPA